VKMIADRLRFPGKTDVNHEGRATYKRIWKRLNSSFNERM